MRSARLLVDEAFIFLAMSLVNVSDIDEDRASELRAVQGGLEVHNLSQLSADSAPFQWANGIARDRRASGSG